MTKTYHANPLLQAIDVTSHTPAANSAEGTRSFTETSTITVTCTVTVTYTVVTDAVKRGR